MTSTPTIEDLITTADRLAATLALVLYDAHPIYANTTGWRGGIGGQAMTQGCSFIDPPPGVEWAEMDLPSTALREWLRLREGRFDLDSAKDAMKDELTAMLNPPKESR